MNNDASLNPSPQVQDGLCRLALGLARINGAIEASAPYVERSLQPGQEDMTRFAEEVMLGVRHTRGDTGFLLDLTAEQLHKIPDLSGPARQILQGMFEAAQSPDGGNFDWKDLRRAIVGQLQGGVFGPFYLGPKGLRMIEQIAHLSARFTSPELATRAIDELLLTLAGLEQEAPRAALQMKSVLRNCSTFVARRALLSRDSDDVPTEIGHLIPTLSSTVLPPHPVSLAPSRSSIC